MEDLGGFMVWLRYAPGPASAGSTVPVVTSLVVRQPGRINAVMVAVREFVKHAVAVGDAPGAGLAALPNQIRPRLPTRLYPAEAAGDPREHLIQASRPRLEILRRHHIRHGSAYRSQSITGVPTVTIRRLCLVLGDLSGVPSLRW